MRSILRHLSRVYLAAHLLAWLPAGANGSVLCVEPGGHVRIEVGAARCADAAGSAVQADRTGVTAADDECGPCLDVKLGGPHARLAPDSGAVPAPAVASLASFAGPLALPRAAAGVPVAGTPRVRASARPFGATLLRN